MPNNYFQFKEFRIEQAQVGMKVTTDGCLFGAWIAKEIANFKKESKNLLDIGTGTGLLSLMVAQAAKDIMIDALEINDEVHEEASMNFNNSPWQGQIKSINQSLQEYKSEAYDIIICNPPFFEGSALGKNLKKNQAVHSEDLSVVELLENVLRLLSKNGRFFLLYPEREMNVFISLSTKSGLNPVQKVSVKNQVESNVFRTMAAFEFDSNSCSTSEIIIRNEKGKYSNSFWSLLSDYYLEYNAP